MMTYTEGMKARLVRRMAGPEGISANALSREVGISQSTLSRWYREAREAGRLTNRTQDNDVAKKKAGPRKQRTAAEKLRIVTEAARLTDDELGVYLRREGVHEATLEQWSKAATEGIAASTGRGSSKKSPEAKRAAALERELRRKDKALAELAALLALKKKVQEIWGDEASDTDTRSGT